MSQPDLFSTQDLKDDDGQVIDSLFIETDSPPDLSTLNDPIIVKTLKDPAPFTRTMSEEFLIDPTWASPTTRIVPADPMRKFIFIRVEGVLATDGVRISDDMGTVLKGARVLSGKDVRLDYHTGPLYVFPIGGAVTTNPPALSSDKVLVSVWTVTE
jgi:hypothetical protein